MEYLNILATRLIRIRSRQQLVALILMIVVYFVLNFSIQKLRPETEQKKVDTISMVAAAIFGFISFFV